jgi:hypothetical protein
MVDSNGVPVNVRTTVDMNALEIDACTISKTSCEVGPTEVPPKYTKAKVDLERSLEIWLERL